MPIENIRPLTRPSLANTHTLDYLRSLRKQSSKEMVVALRLAGADAFPYRTILRMNRLARARLALDVNDSDSAELELLTRAYV
jgi:hypothetical protein